MFGSIKDQLTQELADIDAAGLYKRERVITSAQDAEITLDDGSKVLNFCANNYLGLSSHPQVVEAAKRAIDTHGFGMSSVRFICGTQDIHKELEQRIADFHHTEDTILYAAAFDANGGVFEPLLSKEDAIVSDSLNHASIIDGVRLCKAQRYRYANNNMEELELCLKEARATLWLSQMACFPWTAMWPKSTRSAIWPMRTTRWSWWTNATPQASSARPGVDRSS